VPFHGTLLAAVRDSAGDARKSRQRCDMLLRVVIDYLDAVATGVSDKNAAGLRRGRSRYSPRSESVSVFKGMADSRLSRQDMRCFALRGVIFEKRERKAEGHARANLVRRVSTRQRMTYRDVEAEIVAHAVNQADQA
jgi:hypothetical protein